MNATGPSRTDVIRFGPFQVDLRSRELSKQGIKVKLQEQPFHLLQMLLEHPGEIVTRDQLQREIWPADTFVDFDQGLNNAAKRLREALNDSPETPEFIETIPRRGYRFVGTIKLGTLDQLRSLAVLPLENLSRDPEQDYFADGLTEALITNLAKISSLRVVSRTTAMHYKGVHRPLPEIARELAVDRVVEGTVLRSGERVRISAQLIDAATDAHLWAESYERDLRDVLMLQSEVARAIVKEIRVKLPTQEHAQLMRSRVVDPQAYEYYLRGRYHWNKRSVEGIRKGAECFQHAIEIDPTYAPAYSGLADSAGILGWWCFVSPDEGCRRGKAAALKALAIDDELAEAHASLGWNLLHYDYDFISAESEFQRALEIGPRNPTAVQWHAVCLTAMLRLRDGVDEILRAAQLDPLSPIITTTAAIILWQARHYEQGLEMCRKALDLAPEFSLARWAEALLLSQMGMYDTAIAEMEELVQLSPGLPLFVHLLGNCYAMAGKHEEALRVVQRLKEISKVRFISAFMPASIYACLNEIDQAFHWLEKAYHEHAPWMAAIKPTPWFDHLRSDPRFEALLDRMNFPQ